MEEVVARLWSEIWSQWVGIAAAVLVLMNLLLALRGRREIEKRHAEQERLSAALVDQNIDARLKTVERWRDEHMSEILPMKQRFEAGEIVLAIVKQKTESLEDQMRRVLDGLEANRGKMDELIQTIVEWKRNNSK